MVSITLDERDRAVLSRLCRGDADVESLAESVGCRPAELRDRLPELADNGLVRRVDRAPANKESEQSESIESTEPSEGSSDERSESGGDVYAATANGRRVLDSSPDGTMDDRIDTPAAVEEAIRSFDLRADREEALRNAFTFLRYWGEAHESEIVDGVYSENPAGFESSEEWWTDFVRERLAELPSVDPSESTEQPWRYTGTPIVDEATEDGRSAPSDGVTPQPSVKYALEHSRLDEDERSAVRAAFEVLLEEREADADEIRDASYPGHEAGYDSAAEWWTDLVRGGLELLPGVERTDDARDGWRYRQPTDGPTSSGVEADDLDGSPDSQADPEE